MNMNSHMDQYMWSGGQWPFFGGRSTSLPWCLMLIPVILYCNYYIKAGVQKHGCAARPKSSRASDEKISQRCDDQNQPVLEVDLRKKQQKGHGTFIAAAIHVLPLGLGKFRFVLEVDLQKKEKVIFRRSMRQWNFCLTIRVISAMILWGNLM